VPYENGRPLRVPPRADGSTLLALLTATFPHIAREEWLDAIEDGRLRRNGQMLSAADMVRSGERIEHVQPGTVEPDVAADIQILHEDAMLVIVNKPAPLPMHPCGRYNRNTLISILEQVYHPHRLRAAHRLDANTTGVAVLTRSRAIAGIVQPQFERGEVEKRYLALVEGTPDCNDFCCAAPITESGGRGGRREVVREGLPSHTDFRVLERRCDGTTLLEARPRTGRTNQIRLHLAHLGWPIRGDRMYGAASMSDDNLLQTLDPSDPPLCLHAWQIALRHPLDGKPVRYTAPPPAILRPRGVLESGQT
jgi:RluA family pseudouridine synthase